VICGDLQTDLSQKKEDEIDPRTQKKIPNVIRFTPLPGIVSYWWCRPWVEQIGIGDNDKIVRNPDLGRCDAFYLAP